MATIAVAAEALEALVRSMAAQRRDSLRAAEEGSVLSPPLESVERLLTFTASVRAHMQVQDAYLSVREAAALQETAQRAWNATTEGSWGTTAEGAARKARYRQLITLCFVLGSSSPATARSVGGLAPVDAGDTEKAVLMCLKTANALAGCGDVAGAEELLSMAQTIVAAPPRCHTAPAGARLADLRREVLFARLSVSWEAGQYAEVEALATALRRDVVGSRSYEESFLRLLFAFGGGAVVAGGARLPSTGPAASDDVVSASEVVTEVLEGSLATPNLREQALQKLLALSLDLQRAEGSAYPKSRTLYGTTLLQLAASQCRVGEYASAVANAQAAYGEMHSMEPLALELRARAGLAQYQEALALFRLIAEPALSHAAAGPTEAAAFSVEDVFSLALLVTGGYTPCAPRGVVAELVAYLTSRRPQPADGERYTAYLCCLVPLLLYTRTDESVTALCDLCPRAGETEAKGVLEASSLAAPTLPLHRLLFSACWTAGEGDGDAVTVPARFCALRTALRFASTVASAEEVEAVLVRMAELAFVRFREDPTVTEPLRVCASALEENRCPSLYARLAACQIAFALAEGRERALTLTRDLLTCAPTTGCPPAAIIAAFGSLVNFLLALGRMSEAADVAGVVMGVAPCAPSEARIQDSAAALAATATAELPLSDAERLAFLRVCANGLVEALGSPDVDRETIAHIAASVCAQATPLLLEAAHGCLASGCGAGSHRDSGESTHPAVEGEVGGAAVSVSPHPLAADALAAAEERAELTRWCRLLWFLASEVLLPLNPALALTTNRDATELYRVRCCDYADADSAALLVDRVLFSLWVEFNLFVSERPLLPPDTIESCARLLEDCGARALPRDESELPVAAMLALARAECCVRQLAEVGGPRERTGVVGGDACAARGDRLASACIVDREAQWPASAAEALDGERLVGLGVPSDYLAALAAAAGTAAFSEQEGTHGAVLTACAVDLQLAAVRALLREESAEDDEIQRVGRACALLFRAHQLTGDDVNLRLRVAQAAAAVVVPRLCAAAATAVTEDATRGGTAAAFPLLSDDAETVLEFLSVEAWNTAVGFNATRSRPQTSVWRAVAMTLSGALPKENGARSAIAELAESMPVM